MERRWSVDGRRKSEARQGGGWSRSWVLGERVDLDEHARACVDGRPLAWAWQVAGGVGPLVPRALSSLGSEQRA